MRPLNRVCRLYATLALAVPVLGVAITIRMHILSSPRLIASMTLTTVAAAVLLVLLSEQERALEDLDTAAPSRLASLAGAFNLLWATVTILMITRPGSTTGV